MYSYETTQQHFYLFRIVRLFFKRKILFIPKHTSQKKFLFLMNNTFIFGRQEFWLEKSIGMVCMALSSKALVITGIDDRRYWVHIPTTESR
jgi:hypothetical protein